MIKGQVDGLHDGASAANTVVGAASAFWCLNLDGSGGCDGWRHLENICGGFGFEKRIYRLRLLGLDRMKGREGKTHYLNERV